MVKVLPEPVTPSSTWSRSPASAWATSSAMAAGWSPAGVYCVASRNGVRTRASGRAGRCGAQSPGLDGASSGVRRGPATGANIGAAALFLAGVWTGFFSGVVPALGVEERFMNGT